MIGRIFGRLTVLEQIPQEKYDYKRYLCECQCGKRKIMRMDAIKSGRAKSCGCYQSDRAKQANSKDDLEMLYNRMIVSYKTNAISRGFTYSLTKEQFIYLVNQDCYYCGSQPKTLEWKSVRSKNPVNGIDRLDNSKGYVLENCKTCCPKCNMMKRTMLESDFADHVIKIANYLKSKEKEEKILEFSKK